MNNIKLYKKFKDLNQIDLDDHFQTTCEEGNLETVKYLLTSSELKKHADMTANGNNAFLSAYYNNSFDILKYLIFDMSIKKSPNIIYALKNDPKEEIIRMFNVRKLNNDIEKELNSDKINKKKMKV